jgi:tetrahydromethanopterin S-methyltransferase subunit B
VPWVLIVLAAVIGLLGALNLWVKRQVLDTGNFTDASARLLENDEIRSTLSVYLTDQLFRNVDVEQTLEQNLPPRAKQLAGPLAAVLEPAAARTANEILGRPRVQALWRQANRKSHTLLIAALEGKNGVLENTNGEVILNVRPLVEQVAERTGLGSKLLDKLPPDAGQIRVMNGNQVQAARKGFNAVRAFSYLLTFIVIALFALAVYLGRGRRRTLLLAVGVTTLIVGLLLLVVRRFTGNYLVDALAKNPDLKPSVRAVWAIETGTLRNIGINVVVYGVAIIFAAWIAGPSRLAVWVRRVSAPTILNHPVVLYGVVTLVLLIILVTGPTDGQRIYPLLVLFALAYVGTELLRRQVAREFPQVQPAAA